MTNDPVQSEGQKPCSARKLPTILFAHGMQSEPWTAKIQALAEVARDQGNTFESPDFRGMDDPEERVAFLVKTASGLQGPFILVGSSLGGYVAVRASNKLQTAGLFLMAPALGLPNCRIAFPEPHCPRITIVHAWKDEITPVGSIIEYAQRHHAELHVINAIQAQPEPQIANAAHRLHGQIPLLKTLFDRFLSFPE